MYKLDDKFLKELRVVIKKIPDSYKGLALELYKYHRRVNEGVDASVVRSSKLSEEDNKKWVIRIFNALNPNTKETKWTRIVIDLILKNADKEIRKRAKIKQGITDRFDIFCEDL